jgi:Zn-dependent protease with chaperone function
MEGSADVEFVGEFFRAIPEAFVALWGFISGWRGVAVTVGSILLGAAFTLAALRLRERSGWLSSIFGLLAGTIALWWLFGIIPSAWFYFSTSEEDILAGRVIPNALPGMNNFYSLFRDLIVVAETGVGIGLVVVASLWIQKRYPRSLAEGEEARPQSGGYK